MAVRGAEVSTESPFGVVSWWITRLAVVLVLEWSSGHSLTVSVRLRDHSGPTTDDSNTCILRAALVGLVQPPLGEHVDVDPPIDDLTTTDHTVFARLDVPDHAVGDWELLTALAGVDHYTLRLTAGALHATGWVQPTAMF